MGQIGITGSSGGADTDGLTAVATHVLKGETFYGAGSDEQQTGTMTVNSLLSFSCAAYSGRRILAKWQNPKAATGKPYSGVIIRYSTSGYPGKTGGTQIYKGAGSNTTSGGAVPAVHRFTSFKHYLLLVLHSLRHLQCRGDAGGTA